tara:strand:- start:425 stop:1309 length:885 start_codon:yes stop_codon:yes gene_type:complete
MSILSGHNKELARIKQYNLQSNVYNGRDPDRYYLEEYFKRRPALNSVLATNFDNADATNVSNTTIRTAEKVANKDFEVLGTNMTSALSTFDTDRAGIKIETAGADQDQAIIAPHLDTNQTAWSGIKWGTENQVQWECSITTGPDIADVKIWAGLKLTNDQLIVTDDDQAYFKFQTDADNSEAFTTYTTLHFVHSISNTDYISDLGITVAADTNYHLKIIIDSNRKISAFVNGVQYSLTSTAGSTGGTTTGKGFTQSAALSDDIDFIPYIGVEAGAASAKHIIVHYEKMSRILFE